MLLALKAQARANGPGRLGLIPQRANPRSIQNSGANRPSTAFSEALSAVARRISCSLSSQTSRPTIQLSRWRAVSRSPSPSDVGNALTTALTLDRKLLAARALAKPINSRLQPNAWMGDGAKHKRSIVHPTVPLPSTTPRVITPPPSLRAKGLSPTTLSNRVRVFPMNQPITTTGCTIWAGSPINQSSPAAAATTQIPG